jgi:1-deoxy-D-xylulose-5-phosphate reductoisomerase
MTDGSFAKVAAKGPREAPMGVAVLGSTGSIGVATLDVMQRHPEQFRAVVLTANHNAARLKEQCLLHRPSYVALGDAGAAKQLADELQAQGLKTRVLAGPAAIAELATLPEVDTVMAAIVGAAGLKSALAAARAGKRILLANKEALVMSGPLFMQAIRDSGATLIPVDSEHNAIFQCLPPETRAGERSHGVRKVLLTASGGPFLRMAATALADVTPEQACAHPRWVMGRKISVDSATLMNKGLELIEACLLFGLPPADVEVVVHPQSIVHSLVEYRDGSVLAQLGNPDMRTPIAHALGWPARIESGVLSLDLVHLGRLDFEAPDLARFPCLGLAQVAAAAGGTAPAVLNAVNEVAVARFLDGQLSFPRIAAMIEQVLGEHHSTPVASLDDVLAADAWARERAAAVAATFVGGS